MKISIVTVAFNAATTIRDTLASITSQRHKDVECIVIDGGSTDGTQSIVEAFGERITHFVSERDAGIYDAMNKGLALVTGDVVAFLNADDFYVDNRVLEDVAIAFDSGDHTVVAGAVEQIDSARRIVRIIRPKPNCYHNIRWCVVPPHPGIFVRTELARAAGGFDPSFRIAGDFDLFIRLTLLPNFRMGLLRRAVVKMRTGGVSTSGFGVYKRSSRELKRALVKNGLGEGAWRANLRAFRKIRELVPWRG